MQTLCPSSTQNIQERTQIRGLRTCVGLSDWKGMPGEYMSITPHPQYLTIIALPNQ